MHGYLRTCPVCGKKFGSLAFEQWIYKIRVVDGTLFFCGWNCMRKYEKAPYEERLRIRREYKNANKRNA